MALSPVPRIGTANAGRLSALVGLLTVSVAVRGNGHSVGAAPAADGGGPPGVNGSQGQLCWGAKEIVIKQLCCGARENVACGALAQLSCSVKLWSPVKSLKAPKELPGSTRFEIDKPVSVAFEGSVFVRVIVCVVGGTPSACGGNVREAGDKEMGCVQLVEFPSARQMSPLSPGKFATGHTGVLTPYPLAPFRKYPPWAVLSHGTGETVLHTPGEPI